jgi:hypothetical protein
MFSQLGLGFFLRPGEIEEIDNRGTSQLVVLFEFPQLSSSPITGDIQFPDLELPDVVFN